jgi:hypothetical protein
MQTLQQVKLIFKIFTLSKNVPAHNTHEYNTILKQEHQQNPGYRESSAGIRHETRLPDCKIGSKSTQEEENRAQKSVIEETPPLPRQTLQNIPILAHNTNIRDIFFAV